MCQPESMRRSRAFCYSGLSHSDGASGPAYRLSMYPLLALVPE